jgi:hypothetical protein
VTLEERRGVVDNRMMRRYVEWQEAGEDRIMRSFIFFTLHQIVLG